MMPATDLRALVRAGQDAERAGRPIEARNRFEAALRALTEEEAGDLASKLLRWIAWTYTTDGEPQAALDCLEAAEAVASAMGDDVALASVLNVRAGTLFGLGELDDAEALFERVRRLAVRVGDRKLEAIADQNLGTVASIRGDEELALSRFRASLASFEALNELSYVGPLLNNIGRLQSDLAELRAAERTLERARRLCVEQGDRHHLVIVEVNRARVMLRSGDALTALRTTEAAREIADSFGDDRWLGDILLVCGSAHNRLGNPDVALEFLERAADVARSREDMKLLADVVLEQARGLRAVGRNRDTLQHLNEARALFARLRARRDLAHVSEGLAELESAFLQIVREWGESIESKDAYTQGHCSRVADYACMLAEAAGVPDEEMLWFRMGALLHDVGKVRVPLEILCKHGRLEDHEWEVMARHPVYGVELLEGIEFPWDVRPMIRHHHERWNGSGYPDRLAGTDIPREARILTIADIYDALTTTRSYRAAYSHEQAMEILTSEVGTTVDPSLFPLFASEVAPRIVSGAPSRSSMRALAV
ncbi:MAG TPA: HD domain-containing phosphohydrolase [Longimicrobiales bacterium]|nr:HD domain-containing phosphohydrolase [Longimicrobiales bacterium]